MIPKVKFFHFAQQFTQEIHFLIYQFPRVTHRKLSLGFKAL